MKSIDYRLINSLLDNDLYNLLMADVVFHHFRGWKVSYSLINRKCKRFPAGFGDELKKQVKMVTQLRLEAEEAEWLRNTTKLSPEFIEWLSTFHLKEDDVLIQQIGHRLEVDVEGDWLEVILWEVILLALISELYYLFEPISLAPDWHKRMIVKGNNLEETDCLWADFGTRRRRSYHVHRELVSYMSTLKGFIGTSNVHFSQMYQVAPIGTYAHQAIQAMSALHGPVYADGFWREKWQNRFKGDHGIALTDTFTTNVFLSTFTPMDARIWDGLRQDSGDPVEWMHKVLRYYSQIGLSPRGKKMVFSDNLTYEKFIYLSLRFRNEVIPIGGIGTHFTNDVYTPEQLQVGYGPLDIVIKMMKANPPGYGWKDVVKLSDAPFKHSGKTEEVLRIKNLLKIA